jgi:deoxyribose-phosphate aldolase
MNRAEFASRIDHTVLGPTTARADVERVLDEADRHGMNACVPPCFVSEAAASALTGRLATVIGFPHGQQTSNSKRAEAVEAFENGADELDVVLNVGQLKAGEDQAVTAELVDVVAAVPIPVKVIVETALLDEPEKHRAARAAVEADAAFLKTSTGFADGGATVQDVELLAESLPVKASGGIGTYEDAIELIDAGAERIGASSGVNIVTGFPE